ncbi:XRE family transcriptional regulator [Pseudoflavonifractor sp. AF19-9AC]|nr:XRE family transcriptional regulator [Pseudoflavonifractor sp. AF19-9AC]
MAERTRLSATYLSHIEHGRKQISLEALVQIATALDLPLNQLLELPDSRKGALAQQKAIFRIGAVVRQILNENGWQSGKRWESATTTPIH